MTDPLSSRLVKFVNAILIVAAIAVLGAVYWFAWRPLAQHSGTIDAAIGADIQVNFDSLGEPHIRAASLDDALFAQGYVTAQDRMFQMDLLRRFSAGELSELFGARALETDQESRRLRLRRIAEDAYLTMPAAERAAMAAYTRGVNQYLATHLHNLPLEFTAVKYQPRPWSVIDSLLICLHMYRDLTTTFRTDLLKRQMRAAGDANLVDYLFPGRTAGDFLPGSNGWAVAGSRTASGKPLLSNDMHLEYSLPGIWYMTHLSAPGFEVAGVALPGAPGIIVGHNQRIAWGITNLGFDVQDLYVEKIDERTGRYLYQGHIEQARGERERIAVKGQPAVEMTVWVTRHGPIFAADGKDRMSLRWTAAEPGFVQYPFLDIDRAGNWQEFTAALSRLSGPGSNFVYADVDGNIGYHAAGFLPKRHGYRGDVPVDGSTGEFEWDGFMKFDELPSSYNPASGMVVTANQNPFPADFPYPVNGNFAAPFRAQQIRNLLAARKGWQASDMITVQKDVYAAFDHFLAYQLVAAYDRRKAHSVGLDAVIALLRKWDGQMDKGLAAPFVVELAYQHVRTAMVERAAPGKGLEYLNQIGTAVVEKLLRERPEGWFDDYDSMLLRAFVDAVEEGKRIQGNDVEKWQYGRYLRISIDHPVTHQIPMIGHYFDIGPVPMSGSGTTVKQTTTQLAPSMRMTADTADWERSLLNLVTGQSGQVLSTHYRDQWDAYYYARTFPMPFGAVKPSSTLTFHPR
jgi:penicillin G amidase